MRNECKHERWRRADGVRMCRLCKRSLEPEHQGRPAWPSYGRSRARRLAQRTRATR